MIAFGKQMQNLFTVSADPCAAKTKVSLLDRGAGGRGLPRYYHISTFKEAEDIGHAK